MNIQLVRARGLWYWGFPCPVHGTEWHGPFAYRLAAQEDAECYIGTNANLYFWED